MTRNIALYSLAVMVTLLFGNVVLVEVPELAERREDHFSLRAAERC